MGRQQEDPTPGGPPSGTATFAATFPRDFFFFEPGERETRRAPSGPGASGWAASTAWVLIPPNPKAFTAATRRAGWAAQSNDVAEVTNRVEASPRIRLLAVQGGRGHPVVDGECRLDQPGGPGGRHGVTDHRLDRAHDTDPALGETGGGATVTAVAEEPGQGLQLGGVPRRRGGPVGLDQPARRPGSSPASAHARSRASSCPPTLGFIRLRRPVRPTTPRARPPGRRSGRRHARRRPGRFRTTMPDPSPMSRPSARRSKGRMVWLGLRAPS